MQVESEIIDPLSPPRPHTAYYDEAFGGYVLSRYADVLAAFREPRLAPTGPHRSETQQTRSEFHVRSQLLETLTPSRLSRWQTEFENLAYALMSRLPRDRPVDVLQEFAYPWCRAVAVAVTGANPVEAKRLASLASEVSASAADPLEPDLQSRARGASAELDRMLDGARMPMSGPAFVALSQTLPCFLANAWVALIRHPADLKRLRADSDLMPNAIEELLRYAGLARTIFRCALATVRVADITITEGERVALMLASANRDPTRFPEPDRLNIGRRALGHVAFGWGPHSCPGSSLIRMAASVATGAFAGNFMEPTTTAIEWHGGSGFRSAVSLHGMLRDRH